MLSVKNLFISALTIFSFTGIRSQLDYMEQWPGFRGPFATGILDDAGTPIIWNIGTGENIKWKTPIPGLGHSCPVIWGDRLFVTTVVSGTGDDYLKVGLYGDIDEVNDESIHEFKVYCLDKYTGEIIWERLVHKGIPISKRHTKSSHANSTPATDGKNLVVFFGSEGMYCFDLEGNLRWKKDLGRLQTGPYDMPEVSWGFASSPVIYDGVVIIQCDVTGDDFLAAFNVETGQEIWRTPRDEISTWGSPSIYSKDGKTQIIVNGFKHMGGYDFKTGEEIWEMSGGGDAPAPTPVITHDLIFLNNAHGKYSPIYVVRPDAKGDITLEADSTSNEYILWSIKRGGAYMQTPLIYGDFLYNIRMNGSLSVFKAVSGELIYKENLEVSGGVTASGIASDGKIYITAENGDVFVVRAGPEYELLAKNSMGDLCMATPAITKGAIFFRTQHYVIAVSVE